MLARLIRVIVSMLIASAACFSVEAAQEDKSSGADMRRIFVQVIDSATGYSVNPQEAFINSSDVKTGLSRGRIHLDFPAAKRGSCTLTVHAHGYRSLSGVIALEGQTDRAIRFLLDPLDVPREVELNYIAALRRPDATIFLGFAVDDALGFPLEGVKVRSDPSGVEAWTDARGFFQIAVSLPPEREGDSSQTCLTFEKPGYTAEEYRQLQLWPNGDWAYQIRLRQGQGKRVINDDSARRHRLRRLPTAVASNASAPPGESSGWNASGAVLASSTSSNFTVRVPWTIRVLLTNGTIEYVSIELYCRRSLPREWFASWNNYTGGINSLKAGAVAVRTYAIGYVNNPRGSDHDICATTSCQVYGSSTSSSTDSAVNQTTSYVMVNSTFSIPRGLTEYSSENNQLGMPCGDGYTAPGGGCLYDPVCAGEPEFGHGRGMCQWGSVKWATGLKFPGNDFSDTTATNGEPRRDWIWILQHYYPNLMLVQGAPLVAGDDVRVVGISALPVRLCGDGGISNGVACPQVGSKNTGATGTIIDGPVHVVSDGLGYTWWKVQWSDNLIGWAAENWLDRVMPAQPDPPPVLAPISDVTLNEGQTLMFTATATAPDAVQLITGFEGFASGSPNGSILFRQPTFSGSTAAFLDSSPNLSSVTSNFPPGNPSTRALQANWSFNTNAWLRLTTFGASSFPNPVIDFTKALRFDVHSDRALRIGVGLRETTNSTGTPLGSDGGTTGGIEWAGVTNRSGGQPKPIRTVAAGDWTNLTFSFPDEPITNYSGGNGILSTASGLGALEHLAFVPADGIGAYNVYLDNFAVVRPRRLTFSLEPGAPSGATINPTNGAFTWTPTEAQGPVTNMVAVRVTDDGTPNQSDTKAFTVIVNEINQPPNLTTISNQIIHAGTTLRLTNSALDADIPANMPAFSLIDPPAGASIGSATGIFTWPTSDAMAGTSNNVTVRVTDGGSPPLSDAWTFAVLVALRPSLQAASGPSEGSVTLTWSAIAGKSYRIQYKHDLNESAWSDLGPPLTASGPTAMMMDTPGTSQRFYRISLVE